MKLSITRANKPYELPRPVIAAGALLVLLGLTVAVLADRSGPVTCPFRLVTGVPCPTCGMVRATHHVLAGEFADAWGTNPLDAFTLMIAVPFATLLLLANRLGGWTVRVRVARGERIALWLAAAAALAANWYFVLSYGA